MDVSLSMSVLCVARFSDVPPFQLEPLAQLETETLLLGSGNATALWGRFHLTTAASHRDPGAKTAPPPSIIVHP